MREDNLSLEARVIAQDALLRALFARRGPLERVAIRTHLGAEVTQAVAQAIRYDDEAGKHLAEEVRVAIERLIE